LYQAPGREFFDNDRPSNAGVLHASRQEMAEILGRTVQGRSRACAIAS
jgi:hypothetical protein